MEEALSSIEQDQIEAQRALVGASLRREQVSARKERDGEGIQTKATNVAVHSGIMWFKRVAWVAAFTWIEPFTLTFGIISLNILCALHFRNKEKFPFAQYELIILGILDLGVLLLLISIIVLFTSLIVATSSFTDVISEIISSPVTEAVTNAVLDAVKLTTPFF